MSNEKNKVPSYVVKQWTGKDPPRVTPPEEWLKQENVKKYDVIEYSFKVIKRHKAEKE